jgi:TrmH family RNA methyltransferase
MVKVFLKRGRDESLRRFHPWVFSGAVAQVQGSPAEGDIVGVYSAEGQFLASGHWQVGSIAVRILSFDADPTAPDFWTNSIARALQARIAIGLYADGSGQLLPETSGCAGPLPSDDGPLPLTMPRVARFPGAVATTASQESRVKCFEVSKEVYSKISYREGTEGIIAEVRTPERKLEDLVLPERPLVVVLERVEKPGNLGAVLRSADAAGADAVLVCDPLTDLWNPNLIRASVGAVFTVPVVACSSEAAIAFLKAHGIRILTAQLQDSHLYYDTDMKRGTAIVMGTESTGLSQIWRDAADAHIRIPMLGRLDSLNVSVSAAILMFEAVRQRSL